MQKVLPTGNLNVSGPFVRGFARVLLPDALGWVLALACIVAFVWLSLRKQGLRKGRGLELDSPAAVWGQIAFFGALMIATVATLNSYRSVPLLIVLLMGITALVGWVTTSTPYGRSIFAVGGNPESARRVGMNVKRIRVSAFGSAPWRGVGAGLSSQFG